MSHSPIDTTVCSAAGCRLLAFGLGLFALVNFGPAGRSTPRPWAVMFAAKGRHRKSSRTLTVAVGRTDGQAASAAAGTSRSTRQLWSACRPGTRHRSGDTPSPSPASAAHSASYILLACESPTTLKTTHSALPLSGSGGGFPAVHTALVFGVLLWAGAAAVAASQPVPLHHRCIPAAPRAAPHTREWQRRQPAAGVLGVLCVPFRFLLRRNNNKRARAGGGRIFTCVIYLLLRHRSLGCLLLLRQQQQRCRQMAAQGRPQRWPAPDRP